MKITIFGDIMWDYSLDRHPTLPVECNDRNIGGILLKVSSAARKHFNSVISIGAVGEKDKNTISDIFSSIGIEPMLFGVSDVSTGGCIIARENAIRKIFLSLRQANMELIYDAINEKEVLSSNFIFVTGWSFLPESKTSKSLIRILNKASEKNVPIIFEILPHHIQVEEMNEDYFHALKLCNILISERVPRKISANRRLGMSVIKGNLKKCKLFILFDWIRNVRVESREGICLSEEPINFTEKSPPDFLDEIALIQVLKHFNY